MTRTLTLALACTLALVSPVFAADSYPHTAAILISGPHNYWDEAYQADMAKLQLVILNSYPKWGHGHRTSLDRLGSSRNKKATVRYHPWRKGDFAVEIRVEP